jgi:hypothetical protein
LKPHLNDLAAAKSACADSEQKLTAMATTRCRGEACLARRASEQTERWGHDLGTWEVGIMQDDVAIDVEVMFEDALAQGLSVEQASRQVLQEPPWDITDDDDGPVIVLALAALQLQHHALDPRVRDLALSAVSSPAAADRFEQTRAARMRVLEQFEAILRRGGCDLAELQLVTNPRKVSDRDRPQDIAR